MSRILITWELGGHLGHLGRLLPVAEAVRQAGHEILFAVCNMRSAAQVLTPRGFEYVQAPLLSSAARLRQPPASYAELLLAEGFGDRDGLSGVLRAWERMFQLYCPDLVLADHSPSVLLGVRRCGIPAVPTTFAEAKARTFIVSASVRARTVSTTRPVSIAFACWAIWPAQISRSRSPAPISF